MAKKNRIEIPEEIAAEVLFQSNRTCVCREKKPVQIHHIDEDPANFEADNLAVLCFDCHRDTQIRGGFDRKLDSAQIRRYRKDWLERIANKREREHGPLTLKPQFMKNDIRAVKHVQIKESSEEQLYSIDAEYAQFKFNDVQAEAELNSRVSSFISKIIDDFRTEASARLQDKIKMRDELSALGWDSLSIVHRISLLTPDLLSIEFVFQTYIAGAAHPNSVTRTLNFRFDPLKQIELQDVFEPSTPYLEALSEYCVIELHSLQPSRWHDPIQRAEDLKIRQDKWIATGTAPVAANFQNFVFVNEGMKFFFDAYQVGSYAEGRYEVFVPFNYLKSMLSDQISQRRP